MSKLQDFESWEAQLKQNLSNLSKRIDICVQSEQFQVLKNIVNGKAHISRVKAIEEELEKYQLISVANERE